MKKHHQEKHPLGQATSRSSAKSHAQKPAAPKLPLFEHRQYIKSGRQFIVAKEQILLKNPNRMKLLRSKVIKTTRASCWLDAKRQFGFELS